MFVVGAVTLSVSIIGKSAIKGYRFVKTGSMSGKAPAVGNMYRGGFQS